MASGQTGSALSGSSLIDQTWLTGTGLDTLLVVAADDPGLLKGNSTIDLREGIAAAAAMNAIIFEGITATGALDDFTITTTEIRALNKYIVANHASEWIALHGDDEGGVETGFHQIQGNGAKTLVDGQNAINTVADGIYHLGFATTSASRLVNEDGNGNADMNDVALWLNNLFAPDFSYSGPLGIGQPTSPLIDMEDLTGGGLDQILVLIAEDSSLAKSVPNADIEKGIEAAAGMNKLIVEAINSTGIAADGHVGSQDVRAVNAYLVANHADEWAILHGDDEIGIETGFHLIQGDGANTLIFGDYNAVNTVADSIYHLGFTMAGASRLANEDGTGNADIQDVALWLDNLLAKDLAADAFLFA